MSRTTQTLPLVALAAAALLTVCRPAVAAGESDETKTAPPPAPEAAQQPATVSPEVIELIKPDSVISVGAGSQSGDRPHLGIFDGMRNSGGYSLLDVDIFKRNDVTGTWNILTMRNFGLSNREVRFEHTRQGSWSGSVEFRQIPHNYPFTVSTRLAGIGSTTQTIGGNPVPQDVLLSSSRDILTAGFLKNVTPTINLKVSFRNEEKDGERAYGRGGRVGSWVEFLTEPMDRAMRQLEGTLDYAGKRMQLSGGYYASWMNNHNPQLNITGGTDATAVTGSTTFTPMVMAPDNQAHQFYLTGGYGFTPSTRGDFRVAYTRATQNANFVLTDPAPYSSSLGGRVDTTMAQYGLSSRPVRKLHLAANVRYQDRDDKTPVRVFLTDGEQNQPYSYTTANGKLEATYLLTQGLSLTGGVDYDWRKRTVPDAENLTPGTTDRVVVFRGRNNETTYRLQVRRSLSETLNGSLAYLHSSRGGSSFLVDSQSQGVSCYASRSAPGLCDAAGPVSVFGTVNPIHFADRERNKVRLLLDWMPFTAVSLQIDVEDSKDDYGHTAAMPYGLRDGTARVYSLDATYSVSQNWQVTAWYSYDRTKANQFNQQSNGYLWTAHLTDTSNPVGIQLRGTVGARFKLGADTQWTSDVSNYPVETSAAALGTILPPPSEIQNKITSVRLFGQYGLTSHGEVRLEYRYDRFRTNDWTWMMWDASGTTETPWRYSDGSFVTFDPRQSASFIAVRYLYRFK